MGALLVVAGIILSSHWLLLLALGVFRAKPHLAMICTGIALMFIPAMFSLYNSENSDGIEILFGPFVFAVFGPSIGFLVLPHWASGAPIIGYSSLAIGLSLGVVAGLHVYKRGARRGAVILGFLVWGFSALAVGEACVELLLRNRIAHQFGTSYCHYQRGSVLGMIRNAESEVAVREHAYVAAGGVEHYWSFSENRWLPSETGSRWLPWERATAVACR